MPNPDPAATPMLSRWSAEFTDPERERSFRDHVRDSNARRLRLVALVAAPVYLPFVARDLWMEGVGPLTVTLALMRLVMIVEFVRFARRVDRDATHVDDHLWLAGVQLLSLLVICGAALLRPADVVAHDLTFIATIISLYVFVPNRVVDIAIVGTLGTFAFSVVTLVAFDQSLDTDVSAILTLLVLNVIGALTAQQMQRTRREEFLAFAAERRTNELLTAEISRRRELESELTHLARHDPLTDLLNRRAFFEDADRELALARRRRHPLSLMILDADHFKDVNDRFGHHTGDEVLKMIARLCHAQLRSHDAMGRTGGEEFAILMPGADLAVASDVADGMRQRISATVIEAPTGDVRVTVSVGLTECRPWEETIHEAMQRADAAMYRAKDAGRDQVVPV